MAPFTWQNPTSLTEPTFSGLWPWRKHSYRIRRVVLNLFNCSCCNCFCQLANEYPTPSPHHFAPLPEPPCWIFMPAPDPRRATEQDSYYVGWSFGFEIQGPSTSSMLFGNKVMSSGDVLCCWQFMWLDLMRKAPTGIRYTCVQASQRGDERRQTGGRIQQGRGGIRGNVMVSLSPYSLKCFKTVKLCEKGSINRMKILK